MRPLFTLIALQVSLTLLPAGIKAQAWPDDKVERVMGEAGKMHHSGNHREAVELFFQVLFESEIPQGDERRRLATYLSAQSFMEMRAYKLAKALLQQLDELDRSAMQRSNYFAITSLGICCMKMKDWECGERYFRRALQMLYGEHPIVDIGSGLNNLGIFFEEKGDLDSAMAYYRAALQRELELSRGTRSMAGSIRDNMASVMKNQGKFEEALDLYRKNAALFATRGKARRWVAANLGVAEMMLQKGKASQASEALEAGIARFPEVVPKFKEDIRRRWLQLSIQAASQMKDVEAVVRYSEQLVTFEDSVRDQLYLNIEQLTQIQGQMQAQALQRAKMVQQSEIREREAKLEQLRLEKRQTWIWIGAILCIVTLFVIILVRWLHFRAQVLARQVELNAAQHQLLKEEFAREQLAKENLELKVELKEQDLTNFALDNRRKRELLKQISKRLQRLEPSEINRSNIRKLLNELMVQMQDETSAKLLEENVEEVNAAFRTRLLSDFPQLTQKEIELCGMVRLGMQSKEIAAQRSVTEGAVKQARKRLRKKLNLEPGEDLRKFLSEI